MSEASPSGTDLAPARRVATPRYQAVHAIHARATANEWVQTQPRRSALSMVVTASLLFAAGFPRERVLVVVAIHVSFFLYGLVLRERSRRVGVELRALFFWHLILAGGQSIAITLTGGIQSPMWPSIVGTTTGTFYVFGRGRESNVAGVWAIILVGAISCMPASILGPPIAHPYSILLGAWAILFALYIIRRSAIALSDAHARTGETLDRMREDVYAAACARARGLESVGAKVAHELKNPLSAVKGLVQLLSRGASDDRSRERLDVIAGEVTRMETILRDYLTFARPLEDLRPEPVDLCAIADDVLAVLEARAESAGVQLSRDGGPVTTTADPRRLKEALLNLVANALEATPRGGRVAVCVTEQQDGGAVLTVRDTGAGMKPEDLARLGTPFFTKRQGGTGLGVVLARAAIRQHGGDLVYESEPGRGTTATATIPASAVEVAAHG